MEVSRCTVCVEHLVHDPRPILAAHRESRIAIVGQAPGAVVHRTGIPWDDQSGENLRRWLGTDAVTFYDAKRIALVPMGFCYPGKGRSGDLPPRRECAPLWHERLFREMKNVRITLLVGKYAQDYYLESSSRTLTATVKNYLEYLPDFFPLPHPSPRNNIWQSKNKWFGAEVLPVLRDTVSKILSE